MGHKKIEDIKVGDKVWAYDEKTKKNKLKKVVRLFRNKTKEWFHVFINKQEIVCTGEHPFYINNKGWVKARDLIENDEVIHYNEGVSKINKICKEVLDTPEDTYNFEVEDCHTYYVTDSDVLVHNKCGEILQKVPDGYEPTYKNGTFEQNPKHGKIQKGRISKGLTQEYGQYALDNSVSFEKGKARFAYNGKEIIQLFPHNDGLYHGFYTDLQGINDKTLRNYIEHYFRL